MAAMAAIAAGVVLTIAFFALLGHAKERQERHARRHRALRDEHETQHDPAAHEKETRQ